MNILGVIPARYHSKRFEGKVIADLCGKPVVQWVWENVRAARSIQRVMICTDDRRVARVVSGFGAEVLMTPASLSSGTERIVYAVKKYKLRADIVVNIQADEPFLKPSDIDILAKLLKNEKKASVATLKTPLESDRTSVNVVKVVTDKKGYALYFSRLPIPYIRDTMEFDARKIRYYQHVGIYAYTRNFLKNFKKLASSALEQAEKLEQLRFLENGYSIKVAEIAESFKGIDTPEDLKQARRLMQKERNHA